MRVRKVGRFASLALGDGRPCARGEEPRTVMSV